MVLLRQSVGSEALQNPSDGLWPGREEKTAREFFGEMDPGISLVVLQKVGYEFPLEETRLGHF